MSRQPLREAWTIDQLNSKLAISLGLAINHSTYESYSSALNSYLTFCCLHGFNIEPTQRTLAYYVTFQSSYINPKSVDSYLSGICNQLESHFPDIRNVCKSPMVSQALKGVKHRFGRTTTCKLPLTTSTPFSTPSMPTPLTMMSYSPLSFSLGLKIYSTLANSAGLTKLPYTIIARWLCDILLKYSTIISASSYPLIRGMPSLRVTIWSFNTPQRRHLTCSPSI